MAVYCEILTARVPLDQRRHYLACMEEVRRLLTQQSGVVRFLVLEDRDKLGQFVEIIEYASSEVHAALAADARFRQRLADIDGKVEALVPGQKRERRVMVDRQ